MNEIRLTEFCHGDGDRGSNHRSGFALPFALR